MRSKNIFLGVVLMIASSCSTQLNVSQVSPSKNQLIGGGIEQKKELVTVITPYKQKLEDKMNQKISHTTVELNRKGDNSLLGQLLSDFVLERADEWAAENNVHKVDAAILNIGGIRNDISKGDILLRNVFEVMPFENELVIIKMKGEDIHEIFDYYEKHERNNPVSGFNMRIVNGKVEKGLIVGEEPKAGKDYYIATSDYLAQGGDYMSFFAKGELMKTGITLRDLFIEKFKQNPEVRVKEEVRLERIYKR